MLVVVPVCDLLTFRSTAVDLVLTPDRDRVHIPLVKLAIHSDGMLLTLSFVYLYVGLVLPNFSYIDSRRVAISRR